jgi:N6-adenosine-specific RNA methylase IME4
MVHASEKVLLIRVSEINVIPEYENLVHEMNSEDDKLFDASVKEHGIREKLTLNRNRDLLDGHHRRKKSIKYNIESVPYEIKHFETKLQEKKYVIECNLERRNLNSFQKVELGMALIEIESVLAKKRKTSKLKQNKKPLAPNDSDGEKGKTVDIVSKKIKVSSKTMERAKAVIEKGSEELKKEVREGKKSISSAYQQVTKKTRNLPKVKLPEGSFDVILCDVPIGFDDSGGRGAAENHYPTMTALELSKLKIPSSENAIIFFWITPSIQYSLVQKDIEQPHGAYHYGVPTYKFILDAWGFMEVKGEFVWNKEIIGLGNYNRNQHENCIIAIKGKFPPGLELSSSVINQKRSKHSLKPQLHSIIEKMYPQRSYLELFGRAKVKGWMVFGNEVKEIAPPKQTTGAV